MPLGPAGKAMALGFALALAVGGSLLLLPGAALPAADFPGCDKLAHAGLFFMVGVETLLVFAWRRSPPLFAWHYAVTLLVVAALGAASETVQSGIPGRSADLTDFAADVLGGAAGVLAFRAAETAGARQAPK